MEKNEIKKEFYKQKPTALFMSANKDGLGYKATLMYPDREETYFFRIPFTDIGDASFDREMDAKLLLRWL